MTSIVRSFGGAVLGVGLALVPAAAADTLITADGRMLECEKAREKDDAYALTFASGTIEVPKHLIAEVAIEGDMSDYVPQNDDEAKKLEQGFVRYKGRRMGKAAYQGPFRERPEHGLQARKLGATALFVLPSTSPANASVPWDERLRWFQGLRDFLHGPPAGRVDADV